MLFILKDASEKIKCGFGTDSLGNKGVSGSVKIGLKTLAPRQMRIIMDRGRLNSQRSLRGFHETLRR